MPRHRPTPVPRLTLLVASLLLALPAARLAAQQPTPADTAARRDTVRPAPAPAQPAARPRQWYERISLRGYAQIRYNRLLENNPQLTCAQCDRSIGNHGGIFLRRARLVFSGNVHDRLAIYIQPDYASDAAGQQHYLQIRDAYFDVFLDAAHAHRLRLGQSKIPFGFENLQSSSNRLALDRADPLNSALPNERDMAAIYYWANRTAHDRFRILTDSGLKGSGDYGVVGLGVFNGQTANRPELNDNLHGVAHLTYPFRFPNGQFVELSAHAYHGRFIVPTSQRTSGVAGPQEYVDERVAGSLVVYPQPFGLQAEWNAGRGPAYLPGTRTIGTRHLDGGYVQAMYRARTHGQVITPFVRAQTYDGAKKLDTDARDYDVREIEGGVEWLPIPALELTTTFVQSDRRTIDAANENYHEKGHFVRLQAQFNY
jgi:Phosphate-selective porin O and P